jgi:predicted alpha/beta hydrolase family esterase
MADPRAFISFDADNNCKDRVLFCGQMKNSKTPFTAEDWSSKTRLPQKTWEEQIEAKINCCHMVIVLVGRSIGSATGVAKEIEMAAANNVPVFGVYVDGANDANTLPKGLHRNCVVPWDWDKIADRIDWAMRNGKNKK